MNPNTYIQLNQKPCAAARAGGVGVNFQPKRAARLITRACSVGMDFGSTD